MGAYIGCLVLKGCLYRVFGAKMGAYIGCYKECFGAKWVSHNGAYCHIRVLL